MTADEFRELALSLPEASEKSHMGHPDFRVKGKIFATLGPGESWGMVKLTPKEQKVFIRAEPDVFEAIKGAWGVRGCTKVCLEEATASSVRPALVAAWRNTAPKSLVNKLRDD
ncbi:MAG TPA: MmcQ/YjbR family DNA-binding protein [Gemmataceae bacterium]|nr:MmcQ/YjbR family DNA-binding protein [Gemmataceae bacterium]